MNAKDSKGKTSLHIAASDGYTEIVRVQGVATKISLLPTVLVEQGAGVYAKDRDGHVPFDLINGNAHQGVELRALLHLQCNVR